jgi:hypothetical protein
MSYGHGLESVSQDVRLLREPALFSPILPCPVTKIGRKRKNDRFKMLRQKYARPYCRLSHRQCHWANAGWRGSTSDERCEPPRHVCITADADTIADRERHRGLHQVPDDMLLAPGTDDLERGKGVTRAFKLAWLTLHKLSLFHHRSPSPMASGRRGGVGDADSTSWQGDAPPSRLPVPLQRQTSHLGCANTMPNL